MDNLLLLPIVKPDKNKLEDAYEVADDFSTERDGSLIKVPKFFQYEGASIPSPAWQGVGTPFHPRFMTAEIDA